MWVGRCGWGAGVASATHGRGGGVRKYNGKDAVG